MADVTSDVENGTKRSMGEAARDVERRLDERKPRPSEGEITARIEHQTAKAPSLVFLGAAGLSMAASIALFMRRRPLSAIFVGLWPPMFLLLGNYNKLVKLASDFDASFGNLEMGDEIDDSARGLARTGVSGGRPAAS